MAKYKFCPNCSLALTPNNYDIPSCTACRLSYYQNSKPTAGILPVSGSKVLLARRGENPHKGEIDIIGGFLDDGEHPADGARREAFEETNLIVEPTELLDIVMDKYDIGNHNILNIYYIGEIKGGEIQAKDDVASLEWYEIEDLEFSGGFPSISHVFSKLKEWYKNKNSTSQPPQNQ